MSDKPVIDQLADPFYEFFADNDTFDFEDGLGPVIVTVDQTVRHRVLVHYHIVIGAPTLEFWDAKLDELRDTESIVAGDYKRWSDQGFFHFGDSELDQAGEHVMNLAATILAGIFSEEKYPDMHLLSRYRAANPERYLFTAPGPAPASRH